MDKHLGCLPCKILVTIFKVDKRRTSTNGPENKMMQEALHPREDSDNMCQENKGVEDLPALKIALTHRYDDSKTI